MAIVQQKRPDAPHVEVRETDYGAQYVNASSETPVEPAVSSESEETAETAAVADEKTAKPSAKKKGGRPKKTKA